MTPTQHAEALASALESLIDPLRAGFQSLRACFEGTAMERSPEYLEIKNRHENAELALSNFRASQHDASVGQEPAPVALARALLNSALNRMERESKSREAAPQPQPAPTTILNECRYCGEIVDEPCSRMGPYGEALKRCGRKLAGTYDNEIPALTDEDFSAEKQRQMREHEHISLRLLYQAGYALAASRCGFTVKEE